MTTGRENQLTKQVGEYLVSAELCRREFVATTFTGNIPEFDILAVNGSNGTIPLQVKTIKQGTWQLNAGNYLDIEIQDDTDPKQIIKGIKQLTPNVYIATFLIGVIKKEKYRFSYGFTGKLQTLKKLKIKLPSKNNEPDFEFMEFYIKSIIHNAGLKAESIINKCLKNITISPAKFNYFSL